MLIGQFKFPARQPYARWFTVYFFDIGHPCYDQNNVSADQYHVTIWGSSARLIEVACFFEVDR